MVDILVAIEMLLGMVMELDMEVLLWRVMLIGMGTRLAESRVRLILVDIMFVILMILFEDEASKVFGVVWRRRHV